MDLPDETLQFKTEIIPVKELQHGDLILFDTGEISEVVSFSGFVLLLKPLIHPNRNQVNNCYTWNIKKEVFKLIQIIKENGAS